jgi:cobalt-precorrin-5B (C1)-methyltransferase
MEIYQPHPIEKESYEIIDGLIDLSPYSPEVREIYKRVIHTSGDTKIIEDFHISENAIEAGVKAILNGAVILTDVTMVQAGLKRQLMEHFKLDSVCWVHSPETHLLAEKDKTTRSRAAIRRAAGHIWDKPIILLVGDAPTALSEAVSLVLKETFKPELIIGIPVGFVGTEQSKKELAEQSKVPFITNTGTRGGSPIAASVFNALLILASRETPTATPKPSASSIDLSVPTEQGLMRGYTTGSCATAAAKAAFNFLTNGKAPTEIEIELPSEEKLKIPVNFARKTEQGAIAQVTKDAGDDPDVTHKCNVEVEIKKNDLMEFRFFAGPGVGTVCEEGLQLAKGQPAINPTPRIMIQSNLTQQQEKQDCPGEWKNTGLDITVGIPGGEELAGKTYNPRIGVQGGLSILGTSGIVEPKSLSAWKAAVEIYIDVALATQADSIIFSPGKWGQTFFHKRAKTPLNQICMISNFMGPALDHLKKRLGENDYPIETLKIAGHPGKLAKVIDSHWNTHSKESPMAVPIIVKLAAEIFRDETVKEMENAISVEQIIQISHREGFITRLFDLVSLEIAKSIAEYLGGKPKVEVYLADFKGNLIGSFTGL